MDTRSMVLIAAVLLALLALAVLLLVKLVSRYRLLQRTGGSTSSRVVFWTALVYVVCPIDLLPDPVYLEDVGVLLAALHHLGKEVRRRGAAGSAADTTDTTDSDAMDGGKHPRDDRRSRSGKPR